MSLAKYDGLAHLCDAINAEANSFMAIFTAYFDESGTHASSSNTTACGYLSTVRKWKTWRKKWEEVCKAEEIDDLHRNKLENFKKVPEFKEWNEERRDKVVYGCNKIIQKYTEIGVGVSIVNRDFERVMPSALKRAFGGPYGFAMYNCMVAIGRWAKISNQKGSVQYVFESGAKGRHQLDKMISALEKLNAPPYNLPRSKYNWRRELRIDGWSFQSKKCVSQLQSADWLAYEVYKHMDTRVVVPTPKIPIRPSVQNLVRENIDILSYWNADSFREWLNDNPQIVPIFESREIGLKSINRKDLI